MATTPEKPDTRLRRCVANNATLAAVWNMRQTGKMSREAMLLEMVIALFVENERLFKGLVERAMQPPTIVLDQVNVPSIVRDLRATEGDNVHLATELATAQADLAKADHRAQMWQEAAGVLSNLFVCDRCSEPCFVSVLTGKLWCETCGVECEAPPKTTALAVHAGIMPPEASEEDPPATLEALVTCEVCKNDYRVEEGEGPVMCPRCTVGPFFIRHTHVDAGAPEPRHFVVRLDLKMVMPTNHQEARSLVRRFREWARDRGHSPNGRHMNPVYVTVRPDLRIELYREDGSK